ncbi:MAG: 4-hydroxybenzoate octaprenyltransferase [Proteobacteria bacterium]|nr:4-hydroxybenzoate octaprenyltransferase [Pseudomonadota bacterium]
MGKMTKKIGAISDLIRLDKQYGTLLVLSPALWSLFIASGGTPTTKHLSIFVLGAFLMRSAGCVINDIADRGFDPHVERTRSRPLADGRLRVREAAVVFLLLCALSFALVVQLNTYTVALSVGGVLLAALYPFVKRVSNLPQAVLGAAFGWGAVMAWSAVHESVGFVAVLLFVANIFWALGYDTVYALMDIEDDKRIGVKSAAILFGARVYTAVALLYLAFFAVLAVVGLLSALGALYFAGLALGCILLLWSLKRVKERPTRKRAFNGFLTNAAVGMLILACIIIDMNL